MKAILLFLLTLLYFTNALSRNIGETEITAEEGIDVFQEEKYYLLKKNVKIDSDKFVLSGDTVKIYFKKDLYDIYLIQAFGNVEFVSNEYNIKAEGKKLKFVVNTEEIYIEGIKSILITTDLNMYSDGFIKVNNYDGKFSLIGANSSLKTENIIIRGYNIDGKFEEGSTSNEISILNVSDENLAFIDNYKTKMFANIIRYNKETSLIELENNVKIISKGETITGDYGTLDTETNSYKIKSKNTNKVKVIISSKDE